MEMPKHIDILSRDLHKNLRKTWCEFGKMHLQDTSAREDASIITCALMGTLAEFIIEMAEPETIVGLARELSDGFVKTIEEHSSHVKEAKNKKDDLLASLDQLHKLLKEHTK